MPYFILFNSSPPLGPCVEDIIVLSLVTMNPWAFLKPPAKEVKTFLFKSKKNTDENKYFHLIGGGFTVWIVWQITTFLGIILGAAIPEKLGLSFAVPLTFLALLVDDFRKFINVIVIIISGLVATLGYNFIPFKAYVIVAALTALLAAMILTKVIKK